MAIVTVTGDKMKFAYTKLFILVTLLLISGCPGEKPDNYEGKNVVRGAIKKPAKKALKWDEIQKEITDTVDKDFEHRVKQETTKPQPDIIRDKNIYITKEGDTLSGIAGKPDIYNDPLKWVFLYRDNSQVLNSIKDKDNLFETHLPAGLKLKIMPREEIKKNLEDRSKDYFTVNIISSPYMKELAPQAVKLMDYGYFVYISSTMIKDREWYRLRTGFYKTRSEANREGDKIKKQLKISDVWTAKIGDQEFLDFGGF